MSFSDPVQGSEPDSAESPSAEGTSDPTDLEANVAKGSKAHPRDVHQMMGKQPTKKSPSSQRSCWKFTIWIFVYFWI